jgi:hypothetical protein
MMRTASYVAGGAVVVLLAASFSPMLDGNVFSARSETFDARWIAISSSTVTSSTAKQDRLAPPRASSDVQVVATTDVSEKTTILSKVEVAAKPQRSPVRELPRDSARKEKLPVGCDPSFSPVAMPAMAHVTGRCLAQREDGRKLASLVR